MTFAPQILSAQEAEASPGFRIPPSVLDQGSAKGTPLTLVGIDI